MSQETRLIKNTVIYAAGNIGSKILSYVMVMVYSHYILPEELGYYDIIITTVSLLLPIVMVEIHEGMYRYLIDGGKYSKEVVLSTSLKVLLLFTVSSEVVFFLISMVVVIELSLLIIFYSISMIAYCAVQTSVRGLSDNKLYASVGVLNSLIILVVELVGIVLLHYGIDALLFAMGFAYLISTFVILIKKTVIVNSFKLPIDSELLKKLIRYSAPLIPTTICWAVVNSCDRYIILLNLGSEYNGIYAMAAKFPTVITTVTSLFYMAWQEAAIKEYKSANRDFFFSNVYNKYSTLLFSSCICCIPAMKFLNLYFLDSSYGSSWMYTGSLFLASCYMALCSFLGLGYQISKETLRSTSNSLIAALINIGANLMLIGVIGLHAASISTLIAYAALFFIRVYDTKKYFNIHYDWKSLIVLQLISLGLIAFTFYVENSVMLVTVLVLCMLLWIVVNRTIIIPMYERVANLIKRM